MDNSNPNKVISNAITELTSVVEKINSIGDIMLEVAEDGVVVAKEQMAKYGIPLTGTLGESVKASKIDASTARLEADGGHASFVEFGTGIVGERKPHIEAGERSIDYDRNKHGEKGWTYPKDGKFFHTKGQPSKPFWYATGKKLKSLGEKKIVSVLNKKEKSND